MGKKLFSSIVTAAQEIAMMTVPWPAPITSIGNGKSPNPIMPGLVKVFPNLPSCEQEILDAITHSKSVKIFLQLGKTVLVGTPNIYEYLEKSTKAGATVRILHAGLTNPSLSRRVAYERSSSYDEWISDIQYAINKLNNLKRRSIGVVQSRQHNESYYWLMFVFDHYAYVQPYLYERSNTNKSPVFKFERDEKNDVSDSLYYIFDRYFEHKWDKSYTGIRNIRDLFRGTDLETKTVSVASILKINKLFLFVIPIRFLIAAENFISFHSVGGKVAENEDYIEGLKREVNEEIGISIQVNHALTTKLLSSHSDIGEINLDDPVSPKYIYKRTRPGVSSQIQSTVWLLGYHSELVDGGNPYPREEIAAILYLTPALLRECISRKVTYHEILEVNDGSQLIIQSGISFDKSKIAMPMGLAAILASESFDSDTVDSVI
ncbi:NUDIX domain-containing protein [Methylomonas sp. CM2]|uniref:NUDIX domain-containing protein n=1 Tax=Methylomonas sp. CM2 TaxID=3417647 RepID=UPI003CE7CF7F